MIEKFNAPCTLWTHSQHMVCLWSFFTTVCCSIWIIQGECWLLNTHRVSSLFRWFRNGSMFCHRTDKPFCGLLTPEIQDKNLKYGDTPQSHLRYLFSPWSCNQHGWSKMQTRSPDASTSSASQSTQSTLRAWWQRQHTHTQRERDHFHLHPITSFGNQIYLTWDCCCKLVVFHSNILPCVCVCARVCVVRVHMPSRSVSCPSFGTHEL